MKLGRNDLAGKTGTTNDFLDAWFGGFNAGLVAISWVGFDQPKTLGKNETGGAVALPIWIRYMGAVLPGIPEQPLVAPQGLVGSGSEAAYQENGPRGADSEAEPGASGDKPPAPPPPAPESARNQLF